MTFPEGLTLRITKDTKRKTMKIVAYRRGRVRFRYRAVLPMCFLDECNNAGIHYDYLGARYHPRDVDALVEKIVKTYHNPEAQEGVESDRTRNGQQDR